MERKVSQFNDQYILVQQDREVASILHGIGKLRVDPESNPRFYESKSWQNCKYTYLFILPEVDSHGDMVDYAEIWGVSGIPYTDKYATKLYPKISREYRVYCVREGLSGCYMPDNVSYFTSKRATLDYMREVKETLLDSEYVVEGNAESGYDYKWEDQDYFPYGVDWSIMVFNTKKERDQFIIQNQDC